VPNRAEKSAKAEDCREGSDNEETKSVRAGNNLLCTGLFWLVQMAQLHPFVVVENETNAKEPIYDYWPNRKCKIRGPEMTK
jgi:hypothetical protein